MGNFNEKESMINNPNNTYKPMWLPISKLNAAKLYTIEFRDWFLKNYVNEKLPDNPERRKIAFGKLKQK